MENKFVFIPPPLPLLLLPPLPQLLHHQEHQPDLRLHHQETQAPQASCQAALRTTWEVWLDWLARVKTARTTQLWQNLHLALPVHSSIFSFQDFSRSSAYRTSQPPSYSFRLSSYVRVSVRLSYLEYIRIFGGYLPVRALQMHSVCGWWLNIFNWYLTHSGSRPSFIAFCLFCCLCRSFNSFSWNYEG